MLLDDDKKMKPYISYRIGKHHLYGLGTEIDYAKAIQYFQNAKDNKYAQYSFGMMHKRGLGTEANDTIAFEYFLRSANQGNPYAQYEVAVAYENGYGVEKNFEKAEGYYQSAYQQFKEMEKESSDDNLQYRLAKMCYEGKGVNADVSQAISYLEKAVEMKNDNAKFLLAKIWIKEKFYEHNELAKQMLVDLMDQDHEAATFLLGQEYMRGTFFEEDMNKAIECFLKCKDNAYAEYMLYKAYMQRIPVDVKTAFFYLKRSAEHGNDVAQFQYGKRLLNGEYIVRNVEEAIDWFKKSAQQNNMFAQYLLGKLFLFGKEVDKDEEVAIQYLKAAAKQGNPYAQWLLDHKDDYGQQPFTLVVSRFFHHVSRIFQKQMLPDQNNPLLTVDKKLRRKIQEKRSALGHKEDDHSMGHSR